MNLSRALRITAACGATVAALAGGPIAHAASTLFAGAGADGSGTFAVAGSDSGTVYAHTEGWAHISVTVEDDTAGATVADCYAPGTGMDVTVTCPFTEVAGHTYTWSVTANGYVQWVVTA